MIRKFLSILSTNFCWQYFHRLIGVGGWRSERKTRLARSFLVAVQQVRCSFRRRRFTDTGRRCRQTSPGRRIATWTTTAAPRYRGSWLSLGATHLTSRRHRRRTHEYVYYRDCPVLSRVQMRLGVDGRSINTVLRAFLFLYSFCYLLSFVNFTSKLVITIWNPSRWSYYFLNEIKYDFFFYSLFHPL